MREKVKKTTTKNKKPQRSSTLLNADTAFTLDLQSTLASQRKGVVSMGFLRQHV